MDSTLNYAQCKGNYDGTDGWHRLGSLALAKR